MGENVFEGLMKDKGATLHPQHWSCFSLLTRISFSDAQRRFREYLEVTPGGDPHLLDLYNE